MEGRTLLEGNDLVVLETVGTPFAAEALVIALNSGGMSDRIHLRCDERHVLCEIIIQVERRTGGIDDEDLSHFDIQKK